MVFIDKMQDITSVMDQGGLVLMPTDATWCIGGDARNENALRSILNLKKGLSDYPVTLLVNSIAMFKHFFPKLHPRVETLLMFHERPLTLILPVQDSNLFDHLKQLSPRIAVRLSYDQFCNTVIDLMGSPLLLSTARDSAYTPNSFSEISSDVIKKVDYVCKHKINESGFFPEVIASYDEMGILDFIRE